MQKQIEDVIEVRNKSAYSTPGSSLAEDLRDNVSVRNVEGNCDLRYFDCNNSIGPTDSEITLCRVKRENSHVKKCKENNWEVMHDSAIPGDGTHLGESPSLVNLATLVVSSEPEQKRRGGERFEYLVPLSSWEPTHQAHCENDADEHEQNLCDEAAGKLQRLCLSRSRTQNSINSLACSKSVEKQKSTSSMRDLFKRMVFWKRRSRENVQISTRPSKDHTSKDH